jgi:hypothetical protein
VELGAVCQAEEIGSAQEACEPSSEGLDEGDYIQRCAEGNRLIAELDKPQPGGADSGMRINDRIKSGTKAL